MSRCVSKGSWCQIIVLIFGSNCAAAPLPVRCCTRHHHGGGGGGVLMMKPQSTLKMTKSEIKVSIACDGCRRRRGLLARLGGRHHHDVAAGCACAAHCSVLYMQPQWQRTRIASAVAAAAFKTHATSPPLALHPPHRHAHPQLTTTCFPLPLPPLPPPCHYHLLCSCPEWRYRPLRRRRRRLQVPAPSPSPPPYLSNLSCATNAPPNSQTVCAH